MQASYVKSLKTNADYKIYYSLFSMILQLPRIISDIETVRIVYDRMTLNGRIERLDVQKAASRPRQSIVCVDICMYVGMSDSTMNTLYLASPDQRHKKQ